MFDTTTHQRLRAGASHADAAVDPSVCGPQWWALFDGLGNERLTAPLISAAAGAFHAAAQPSQPTLDAIRDIIESAHRSVSTEPASGLANGAVTVVGVAPVVAPQPVVAVFHVGDARCYQLVDGALSLLTRDHTYENELVDAGLVPTAPDGGATDSRYRHVVTQALGLSERAEPFIGVLSEPRGRLLLCTGQVAATLTPTSIGRVLCASDGPSEAANRIVELSAHNQRVGDRAASRAAMVIDIEEAR